MPKAFSDQEKDLIGRRLVEHGYKLFSAYGLQKTNIAEIARAAGISKGAFYLFYESKESLFMDVAEMAEERFRKEILAALERPGPTPRARLLAAFKHAFALVKTTPVLQFFTSGDYNLLFHRVPPEKIQQHLASDRLFFEELVTRCQSAGIPIRAPSPEIGRILYPLVLALLHEDELGQNDIGGGIEVLLELAAAYCLGEIELAPQPRRQKGKGN